MQVTLNEVWACVFISKKGRVSKDENVHLVPGTMVDILHFICY